MHPQNSSVRNGVVVATGYGIKVYVNRGHLVIDDGSGRNRRVERFHRATSKLRRVVIVGHDGFVTLEASRWIRDVGAAFVHVDTDANLIALSAPARHHESKLRRAQVLAVGSTAGRVATIELFKAKLERQARIAERLSHLKATVRVKQAVPITVADAIRESATAMHAGLDFKELRRLEAAAGRNYWQTWARLPVRFDASWRRAIPEHWYLAGSRTATVEDKKRGRKAITPVHAILNYMYAILETEATIAAHKLGFDPSLGLMHADQRYRSSLAADLMEPVRPIADNVVLEILETGALRRGDVTENREGVVRIGPSMATRLAEHAPALRDAVAPHAEQLARTLIADPDHPTPLTRDRHTKSRKSLALTL